MRKASRSGAPWKVRALVIIAIASAASTAAAEAPPPRRQWNVAAPFDSALSGGLDVEVERQLRPRISIAGLVGLRATAGSDFSSRALSTGAEARLWLVGWTVKSPLRESIVGGYLGAGLELSRVWLRDGDRSVGASSSVAATGTVGYRFAPWSRVSITPFAGLGIGRDIGPIPDRWTIKLRWGATFGALF